MTIAELLPKDWLDVFAPDARRIGAGLDVATTTGGKSNPSSLAFTQEGGLTSYVRLLQRFKTSDPEVTAGLLETVHTGLRSRGLNLRRLCIDATSEKFFAVQLRTRLRGKFPVSLVVSSEKTTYMGESMLWKAYLGNLLINTIDDGYLALPSGEWVKNDLRQVIRDHGTFTAEVSADGGHADCFDAIKLSLHALRGKGGAGEVAAASTCQIGARKPERKLLNPYAEKFRRAGAGRL